MCEHIKDLQENQALGRSGMIGKSDIAAIVDEYDRLKLRIGMTASHSALDICDGAIEEGFPTVAYCREGRHKTYANYFKTHRSSSGRVLRGMVDKAIVLDSFNDVLAEDMQREMRKRNVIYIPNRSFTSYSSINDIEENFKVPCLVHATCCVWKNAPKTRIITGSSRKLAFPTQKKLTIPRTLIVWLSSNFTTHKRNLSADSLPVPPTKSIKKICSAPCGRCDRSSIA